MSFTKLFDSATKLVSDVVDVAAAPVKVAVDAALKFFGRDAFKTEVRFPMRPMDYFCHGYHWSKGWHSEVVWNGEEI